MSDYSVVHNDVPFMRQWWLGSLNELFEIKQTGKIVGIAKDGKWDGNDTVDILSLSDDLTDPGFTPSVMVVNEAVWPIKIVNYKDTWFMLADVDGNVIVKREVGRFLPVKIQQPPAEWTVDIKNTTVVNTFG